MKQTGKYSPRHYPITITLIMVRIPDPINTKQLRWFLVCRRCQGACGFKSPWSMEFKVYFWENRSLTPNRTSVSKLPGRGLFLFPEITSPWIFGTCSVDVQDFWKWNKTESDSEKCPSSLSP